MCVGELPGNKQAEGVINDGVGALGGGLSGGVDGLKGKLF